MCDTELVIAAVEKYPCLWDIPHEDYHNREIKDLAWDEVCKEIYKDWNGTDDTGKRKKCLEVKKKWTNVRDCYRKDLQKLWNMPAGSSVKKQKRYIYSDVLSFLAPIFERRNPGSSCFEDQDELHDDTDTEEDNQEQHTSQTPPNANTRKTCTRKDVPKQILNVFKERKEKTLNEDDDTKFLLSFRGDMRRMSNTQKIDFKIGMLELLKKNI